MFTGLIESLGQVRSVSAMPGGKKLEILWEGGVPPIQKGDSVAVNGVCLTATEVQDTGFRAEALGPTLEKSTVGSWGPGTRVNLERALQAGARLGGHVVQGHVKAQGRVKRMESRGAGWKLEIALPDQSFPVLPEGSLAVDGVSLTVAEVRPRSVVLSIIPHTFSHTILQFYRPGTPVNLEPDPLAAAAVTASSLTRSKLADWGWV